MILFSISNLAIYSHVSLTLPLTHGHPWVTLEQIIHQMNGRVFSGGIFFPPKKLFSWLSRAVWHTAQAHKCSSRHWGRNGNTSQSVRERRICHSAASSLSDHIKLIMKLHFEQLQNLPAGQTRGALPRKGENTQKEQISLGVLWKSSREHNEEMFWERELGLVQQCRSCYWQGGFRLFGFGVFFVFFFSPFSSRKNTCIWAFPCPYCSIYPGYKRELKGTAPSEDSDNTFH